MGEIGKPERIIVVPEPVPEPVEVPVVEPEREREDVPA